MSAALGSGCAPVWSETYYAPEAPGANLRSDRCGGGPENVVTFAVDGVAVGYSVRPARDGVDVTLSFEVPRGHSARLLEPRVTARTPDGGRGTADFTIMEEGWQRRPGPEPTPFPVDAVMIGRTREDSAVKSPALFVLTTAVSIPAADAVVVRYPPFLVDDRMVESREIRFSRRRHTQFFMTLNC